MTYAQLRTNIFTKPLIFKDSIFHTKIEIQKAGEGSYHFGSEEVNILPDGSIYGLGSYLKQTELASRDTKFHFTFNAYKQKFEFFEAPSLSEPVEVLEEEPVPEIQEVFVEEFEEPEIGLLPKDDKEVYSIGSYDEPQEDFLMVEEGDAANRSF